MSKRDRVTIVESQIWIQVEVVFYTCFKMNEGQTCSVLYREKWKQK